MRIVHRGILIFVLAVVARPWVALAISGALLAICVGLAASRLTISTDQNKLFDPNVPFFKDYLRFNQLFPENEAIYIVVQARDAKHPPAVARWMELGDSIADRLRGLPKYVKSVDAKVPVEKLGSQGLLFDDPKLVQQNFEGVKQFIALVKLWAEKPTVLTRLLGETPLERFISGLNTQKPDAQTADFVGLLARSWTSALEKPDEPLVVGKNLPDLASLEAGDPSRLGYYYVPDERDPSRYVMLVRVYHRQDYTSLTAISETVEAIRKAAKQDGGKFPEFTVGVTGRPALEADEMRTTDRDSHRAEVVALIAVFIGLVVFLRSVWLALAGEIALGFGIGWTFGWATVSVGELNLLSIVFLLALIGIGMDYLVQVLTRYRQEFLRRADHSNIWIGVFRHVSAPINTACIGAAGAFLVSALTKFRGAAELGIIAGGGLLICLVAGYVVLPALLTIFPPRIGRGDDDDNAALNLGPPAGGRRRNVIPPIVWLVLLIAASPFATRTGFNPNLIELQAPNLESVQLVRTLETWSGVVLSKDLDVLRRARDAVRASPLVDRTESILVAYDNYDWLKTHEAELPAVAWSEPSPVDANDLNRLADKAAALAEKFKDFPQAATPLRGFATLLRGAKDESAKKAIAARLSAWQLVFIEQLKDAIAPFHPQPLDISKLPIELKSHYIGADGQTFALYAYPQADLWDHNELGKFAHDFKSRMSSVQGEKTVTGIVLNVWGTTSSIEKSFYRATIYALGLIFILVLIDLRSIRQTLAAISVLAFGLPMLVSLTGMLGVDWNFANFFALPILIGAGHEYGVFMVHRYREAIRDPRRVWRRWDVADKALLLCAYVTCGSFGFFWMLGHHRGLRSLGLIMALGTACIYLATIAVLRPLLIWSLMRRESRRGVQGFTPYAPNAAAREKAI